MKNPIPYRIVDSQQQAEQQAHIKKLEAENKTAMIFLQRIQEGNLESSLSEDQLKQSPLLLAMNELREQMKALRMDENRREWVNKGLTKFSEILRNNTDDIKQLCYDIISELVKYISAVQGGLFLVEDDVVEGKYIDMKACYAYDRQKFLKKRFLPGEGLIGQCYKEAAIIHLREIPKEYIEVTSGLGEAAPQTILIVPMIINENLIGMIEISSLKKIPQFHIDFVMKLGENIASSIMTAQNVSRVRHLLEQSQMQTEAMRAQEEEMRQNMEELQATQEEMKRRQVDIETANERLKRQEELLRRSMENTREKEKQVLVKNEELVVREKELKQAIESLQTEKTQTSLALLQSNGLLQHIGNIKPIATFGISGEIISTSPLFDKVLGYKKGELSHQLHDQLVFDEDLHFSAFSVILQELASKGSFSLKMKRKTKNNEATWLICHYFALLNKEQHFQQIALFADLV